MNSDKIILCKDQFERFTGKLEALYAHIDQGSAEGVISAIAADISTSGATLANSAKPLPPAEDPDPFLDLINAMKSTGLDTWLTNQHDHDFLIVSGGFQKGIKDLGYVSEVEIKAKYSDSFLEKLLIVCEWNILERKGRNLLSPVATEVQQAARELLDMESEAKPASEQVQQLDQIGKLLDAELDEAGVLKPVERSDQVKLLIDTVNAMGEERGNIARVLFEEDYQDFTNYQNDVLQKFVKLEQDKRSITKDGEAASTQLIEDLEKSLALKDERIQDLEKNGEPGSHRPAKTPEQLEECYQLGLKHLAEKIELERKLTGGAN